PELIFGDARRARAKWAAAARVLADPEARGASYIDLRIPGRPAAGGLPAETVAPVAPAGHTATTVPNPAGAAATGAPAAPGTETPAAPEDAPATVAPSPTTPPAGTGTTPPVSAPESAQPPVSTGAEGGATAPAAP
ncbi:MAG: hypothetical protein ABWY65_08780, partial [Thermoleophilaceae bacterium]